eukprot:CAMPEP_0197265112 /NCGR_PEP_ID=MMETSP1432-20130617/2202_1 /TAXON_ID=44447 /ORGANISM="Pseudo-nitzschia delicatissima, Strain UNC1205" /LENGTH=360 /DNA_ID=CAMNT_0042729825 /DNA_START=88 /DNA_END=1169 /DNA_ORIENTATION=-
MVAGSSSSSVSSAQSSSSSSSLTAAFREKVRFMQTWKPGSVPSNRDKLELYAYHKVAVSGDAPATIPTSANAAERAKYNAWRQKSGRSQKESMRLYLQEADRQLRVYGSAVAPIPSTPPMSRTPQSTPAGGQESQAAALVPDAPGIGGDSIAVRGCRRVKAGIFASLVGHHSGNGLVAPPGATLCPAREFSELARIHSAGRRPVLGACDSNYARPQFGSILLLAVAQIFVGRLDVDYSVRDGSPELLKHAGDSGLGISQNRTFLEQRVDGDYSLGCPQRLGHVRKAPAVDFPLDGFGIAALFLHDWLSERNVDGYECHVGEFFHDCRLVCDLVVLAIDGSLFGGQSFDHRFWGRLLFCPH